MEIKDMEGLINKWNGILPTTTLSNNIPILDQIKQFIFTREEKANEPKGKGKKELSNLLRL